MTTVSLRSHQKLAVMKLATGKILYGGVGSGKSRVALQYYIEKESPKNIYVITTAKKRDSLDWEKEAAQFVIGKEEDATIHGILKVDSWNNIDKYENIHSGFFIFDEQRLVGSGSWVKSFLRLAKNNSWILLSATPGDTWMDYIPVFIANGFYKNSSQFKREHIVYAPYVKFPKVQHYLGEAKLNRLRSEILVKMPYESATTRHQKIISVGYNKDLMDRVIDDRWHVFEDRPLRDFAELYMVMRRVAYMDESRITAIRELLKKHDRLIVFYNFNYELDILRDLSHDVNVAEWNGQKHESLPATDKWIYLVQYLAGAEGWNAIETNAMCFYSMTYSYKLWEQAHGRIDRLNTKYSDLYYYVLRSRAKIDQVVWNSLRVKKSFQSPKNSQFAT